MRSYVFLVYAVLACLLFSDASHASEPWIAVVYEPTANLQDQGFNALAQKGVRRAKEELHFEIKESAPANWNALQEHYHSLLRASPAALVAIGAGHMEIVMKLAPAYPSTRFILVDGVVPPMHDNVEAILFRDNEGGFLAGVVAGLRSEKKHVAFIGGENLLPIQNFAEGFKQGVGFIDESIRVETYMLGGMDGWNNPGKARALALKRYADGVDVIFAAAGASGIGILQAAQDAGAFAIGVDQNQNAVAPGYVLTSVLKRMDEAVFQAIATVTLPGWRAGIRYIGLKEGIFDLARDGYSEKLLSPAIWQRVEHARQLVAEGSIRIRSADASMP